MADAPALYDLPVTNRWTGKVQFTAKIAADPDQPLGVRIGLAVKWAIESGVYLRGANLSDAYLSGANLSGAYLSGANLSDAYLSDADLSGANLSDADLSGANLSGADLSDAYLRGAYLSGADLSGANLSDANLRGAYLSGADLSGANLSDAYLRDAYLRGAYLSGAKGFSPERSHALAALPYLPGKLRAFKLVNANGEGHVNGGIKYTVGKTAEEPNADCDPGNQCSSGLNVADLPWVLREWCEGYRVLVVEFTAKDIACIPHGTDGKFRLKRCKVLSDITDELRANGVFGPAEVQAEAA
jgi:hypothetical protein